MRPRDGDMVIKRIAVTRLIALAGLAVCSAMALGFIDDAKILIDRALNSPTLTVRYSGAAAAMAELRVNGVSLGTRTLNPGKKNGETNFSLDLATLADGENDVEVRLFDKAGKLIGTQKSSIFSDDPSASPVRLLNPKMGATVQGPIEIKVGFGKELKNSYVSFFVNNQFKSMTNQPPYTYLWDTTREPNGWHELEAWVVDEASSTFKTRKTRIFVNNPSGLTPRRNLPEPTPPTTPATNVTNPATSGTAGLKAAPGASTTAAPITTAIPPKVSGLPAPNAITSVTSAASGIKPTKIDQGTTAGAKLMTPGAIKAAPKVSTPAVKSSSIEIKVAPPKISTVAPALAMLPVTKGTKLPNMGTFTILLNAKPISFDVEPRVTDGVPLAPLRHLVEGAGGEVDWKNESKEMTAFLEGRSIFVKIGDKVAKINDLPVEMEIAPFLERGRTVVPLSFVKDSLNVNIEFDPKTGHVLITSAK